MQISKHRSLSGSIYACLLGLVLISLSAMAQTTAPNEWTWMGGSATSGNWNGRPGVYGTLGVPSIGNVPGSRKGAVSWTDSTGKLWMFGGNGYDSNGYVFYLNDLWVFDSSTQEWTWMAGTNLASQAGVYGALQQAAAANTPGGRADAVTWTDKEGNLWLFGGYGLDLSDMLGQLNDLWEFSPSTREWTWMGGNEALGVCTYTGTCGRLGMYGTLGVPAAGNAPGGREAANGWVDTNGDFWLFGGHGMDAWGALGYLNDIWKFDTSTRQWAWMGGSKGLGSCATANTCGQPGVYGTLGVATAANIPGGRSQASSWTDHYGNFWLFGGGGYDAASVNGYLNDLWRFNPSTGLWTWMSGSTLTNKDNPIGVYGTLGVPDAKNFPGDRFNAASWTDSGGNLWLFGGAFWGYTLEYDNDLWEFSPFLQEWTWMGGANALPVTDDGVTGVYGTLGTPAPDNIPGSRSNTAKWTDSKGNFWLFGGWGYGSTSSYYPYHPDDMNDLWAYSPPAQLPPAASPTFSVLAGTYTAVQTLTLSDATPNATIYYTTDGSIPNAKSAVYGGAIPISTTVTIQAIAAAPGYSNSALTTATYTINLPAPDFSVAASPASLTVTAGQSGTATLSVTPLYGFNSAVTFACSGLPTGASCSFSPATVTPSGAAASTTLTVATTKTSAALRRNSFPWLPGSTLAAVLCCLGYKKRRLFPVLLLLAASLAGLGLLNGCGGGSSAGGSSTPQPTTSTVTVTASSGTLQHTAAFTLTVN